MPYDSTITFTLDTICPWTYIAYLRLRRALSYHDSAPSSPATFTLRIAPYQLYPTAPSTGLNRHEWYRDERYAGSEERYQKYCAYMSALGKDENAVIDFSANGGEGVIANTFPAHRVLWCVQEAYGTEKVLQVLERLYAAYFGEGRHPSSTETLVEACRAAGLSQDEAERVIGDETLGKRETEELIRENVGNGVDSVPYVVFEGRKRDFTLIGAKEVREYVKTLEQVAKEAT